MNLFDRDIMLEDLGNSRFAGVISDNWSVNGNPNGGYLMAMIAGAMLRKSDKRETPTVTANYLSRCVPGEVEIRVSEIARSRQFTRFEARLSQTGEEKIRALGTFAAGNNGCGIERYETRAPELAPVGECVRIPDMPKYTLFQQLDLRLDPACAGWLTGRLADVSLNRGYLSFRDGRSVDLLSLFLIIDAMPPAALATQGMTSWVPTVELSVNVRNLPRTDRLRCSLRTRFITCGLLEADGEVWDDEGRLAAISRQIAQFRKE
ncbi:MAG TPA: thioesterase family protein [Syntrophales bacterium]|nr:thioesterase family protein [Syntrophales bacterium]HPI58535.1 thioesterase family protein [Syntrophales bacterium]HPN25629.1 thioesterase family protein [Syntrophales bacterium]HQM28113.1 thioesterase family protein [Syntrophales bacterium]